MIIDKNGKLFGKISIVDTFIILAVVMVILGLFVRFTGAGKISVEPTRVKYVVRVENVKYYTIDALKNKGFITNSKTDENLGEIKDVQTDDMEFTSTNYEGDLVTAKIPGRYVAYVTIEADVKKSDEGYILSDKQELYIGHSYTVSSKYVLTNGIIESIEEL